MPFGLILLSVSLLYAGACVIGWHRGRRGRLDFNRMMGRRGFVDPLTRRMQTWLKAEKMKAIPQRRWGRLRLLIFVNNLAAVALVGRTLYGAALVPAVYLTYRQGQSHGALAAQVSARPTGWWPVAILEFGSYLLATALGVNLVVTPLVGGEFNDAITLLLLVYPLIAAALALAAWLEVKALRSMIPTGFHIPDSLNVDELRERAIAMIRQRSGRP